ncbi:MAG: DUF3098 domain-containing protein [Bacteroidota bacterium]
MSSNKPPKKKVVVSTKKKTEQKAKAQTTGGKKKIAPTKSTRQTKSGGGQTKSRTAVASQEMVFNNQNFLYMGVGILLIIIGFVLMSGGQMPSPDVWDENIIYGFRRTVLAPIFILAGLVVEIYAIFKK